MTSTDEVFGKRSVRTYLNGRTVSSQQAVTSRVSPATVIWRSVAGEIQVGKRGTGSANGSYEESKSCFFISYAHDDAAYVARLAGYLQGFGLPLWFDDHLAWGSRFPQEIRQQLMRALAVIVVMSPAAEASEWVEREILEGQRHDRDFLPILREGERLFLLASSHYFDARDGALPGEREIRQLQHIRDVSWAGTDRGPSLVLRAPAQRFPVPTAHIPADVSPRKLWSFLAEGEVEHADILTTSLLLEAAGRVDSGWMHQPDGKSLPFDLLANIDAAWSKFSQGAQGFRVQLSLHPSHPKDAPAGGHQDFSTLALALGWRNTRGNKTPKYGQFVRPADHPIGFFPTLRNPQLERYDSWHDKWLETVMAVHLQLRKWGGQA